MLRPSSRPAFSLPRVSEEARDRLCRPLQGAVDAMGTGIANEARPVPLRLSSQKLSCRAGRTRDPGSSRGVPRRRTRLCPTSCRQRVTDSPCARHRGGRGRRDAHQAGIASRDPSNLGSPALAACFGGGSARAIRAAGVLEAKSDARSKAFSDPGFGKSTLSGLAGWARPRGRCGLVSQANRLSRCSVARAFRQRRFDRRFFVGFGGGGGFSPLVASSMGTTRNCCPSSSVASSALRPSMTKEYRDPETRGSAGRIA